MNDKKLRELDGWIAKNLFGWYDIEWYVDHPPYWIDDEPVKFLRGRTPKSSIWQEVPYYSTAEAASMDVLNKCLKDNINCSFKCGYSEHKSSIGFFVQLNNEVFAKAKTFPLSICLFAKKMYKNLYKHDKETN